MQGARGEVVSVGFVISLWAGSSAISAFVDSVVEAHDQTPLRHPVRQRFYALGLYVVMLVGAIATAPFIALGPRKIAEYLPDSWDNVLAYGYYPVLFLGLVVGVTILYRVSLPKPLPSHRLVLGSVLATVVFLVATLGLRVYLTLDHQHRLHLRRAGDADRVPVVRVLPRLRDHDGRRTQRRHPGGVACAGHPREAVPVRGSRKRPSRATAAMSRRTPSSRHRGRRARAAPERGRRATS